MPEDDNIDLYPQSLWVKHSRARYVSMIGLFIIEIERTGKRWTTTLTSIMTGEVRYMDTTSPLSVATQAAEKAALEYSATYEKGKQ